MASSLAALIAAMKACGLLPLLVWRCNTSLTITELESDEGADAGISVPAPLVELATELPQPEVVLDAHRMALTGHPATYTVPWRTQWLRAQVVPVWGAGEVVGATGWAMAVELAQPEPALPSETLEVVGYLREAVPLADAAAGDRVVFRPEHRDPERRCVVMHSTDAGHFADALDSGTLEIIGAHPSPAAGDARRLLLRLLRHPQKRLALLR